MSAWSKVSTRLKGLMVLGAVVVTGVVVASLAPFLSCEETAEAGEVQIREQRRQRRAEEARVFREQIREKNARWDREWEEKRRQWDEEARVRREQAETAAAQAAQTERPKRARSVRRWLWESPAETRGRIWNVPEEETEDALLTALLRVCIAEADGDPQDCTGIWQVVMNNRRRSCNRDMIRRITECDEDGETYLSSIRRHQRHALGMIKARNRRAAWISKLTPDCEMPEGWPESESRWDSFYGSKVCPQTVADARRLIAGKLPESRPGHRVQWLPGRPVTWGGRCESAGGACDDHLACSRGLVRIPDTGTLNAFWRRSRGPDDTEPVCVQLGYARQEEPEVAEAQPDGPTLEEGS